MDPLTFDSDVCVCFHVSARKLYHYARRERPAHYALMTECLGAGTGCQSCVPLLRTIAEMAPSVEPPALVAALQVQVAGRDVRRKTRLASSDCADDSPAPGSE